MDKFLVKQWYENKHNLEKYFRTTSMEEYDSYEAIVRKLFELVLLKADEYSEFDVNRMTVIDDGDYQGTLMFIIPKEKYQPEATDYVVTNNYYGSCSGCDLLQSIILFDDGLPDDEQVRQLMQLSLNLVQKMKWIYDN